MTDEAGDAKLLMQRIVEMSQADTWEVAKQEWDEDGIEVAFKYGDHRCLCNHRIQEKCWLRNRLNGTRTYVGNVCIRRFWGLDLALAIDGLRRIYQDIDAACNAALITYCYEKHLVNEWEHSFLENTMKKRNLSKLQKAKRRTINCRIITALVKE